MNYLTLGSILLGATAGLSGAGYFATTYFKSDKEDAKEILDKKPEEKKFVWRYVSSGDGSHVCDFLEVGKTQREVERRRVSFEENSINCQELLPSEILLEKEGKTFFWMEGEREKVDKLLKEGELTDFQLPRADEKSENKGIEGLQRECTKEPSEGERIKIFCKN
ncbi:hypothetical protein [Mycoplasma suis]|uniref:Uncharacterized protein n=1 Tax=Mycoplasma suis (strain Illinois) TaxID=768700 RepID=F0QRN3_MYCSL|nr:hypothetical protein [Mycoplasma suis]ADX98153.1 hypothetical protein MSU_0621 [Mycoplasma suis str. Illinois]